MTNELDNPFSVTKATEFSDEEINDYWVNFNTKEDVSFDALLNPREYLPKYVIGSKGCGKTHILRYFSFPLQKIRNTNILSLLESEKYIGLYSVFHGLNSSRFSGKGITNDQWYSIFEYYFELYICDGLIDTLSEIILSLNSDDLSEKELTKQLVLLFNDVSGLDGCDNLGGFKEFLSRLRRKIDAQILNAAFTRALDYDEVKILFSPGDLIFGIPKVVNEMSAAFKDVKFIYIFDEYEKLFDWQKKFVNTLVWDKKNPTTFWIGARRHGFTTRETKSGQEMKSGSEFQDVNLDKIIRDNEDLYRKFAERLFTERLVRYYKNHGLDISYENAKNGFESKFEKYDEEKILAQIREKRGRKGYEHVKSFSRKLENAVRSNYALEIRDIEECEAVVGAITKDTFDNPLDQKYKIFYFYRLWNKAKSGDTIKNMLTKVNEEWDKFRRADESVFYDIRDKRKKDFIAQLTKENDIKNTEYSGIGKFIELSQGNARHFILILKKTIENSKIRGERPLEEGGKITLDSQYLAVYDTAKWFYEDIEVTGEVGKHMYACLKNLTDYFIQERFCDKPVETTISCFYVKADELSTEALRCLELMKMHSILIEDGDGRYDKNTGRKERLFQLNKILAPLWNLPTVVRGSLFLNPDVAEAIFNFENSDSFGAVLQGRKNELNAPEFLRRRGPGYQEALTF
jgi:hypothetical protein